MPRNRVEAVLKLLAKAYPDQPGLHVESVPLKSLFHIAHTTGLDLKGRPMIRALQESGEERFYLLCPRRLGGKFTDGRLVYLPEMKLLVQLERDRKKRRFKAPIATKLERTFQPFWC